MSRAGRAKLSAQTSSSGAKLLFTGEFAQVKLLNVQRTYEMAAVRD